MIVLHNTYITKPQPLLGDQAGSAHAAKGQGQRGPPSNFIYYYNMTMAFRVKLGTPTHRDA